MYMPFGPWLPDQSAYQALAAMEASGVMPTVQDYIPVPSFGAVASAITARAQGAFAMRNSAGTIFNHAGDATKLYQMAADGLSFADISRLAGGAYACPAAGWWDFARFGDYIIARNGFDATQVYQAGTSTNYAALAGTPPTAFFGGILREFAVAARLASSYNTIAWSAIANHADWVASATTMADSQELPDGGPIMGFLGGEVGRVYQLGAIQRMVFEGPPTIMRFDRITELLGIRSNCERSLIGWEGLDFFIASNGFHMIRGAAEIVPIGEGKVDQWFEETADTTNLHRLTSAINPRFKIVEWSFPDTGATAGTPNHKVFYHWPSGRFAHAPIANHEMIFTGMAQTGYTLDALDTVNPSIDALNHSLDSLIWTGTGQMLNAGFNTSHQSGFFDGTNIAATLDTGEVEFLEGQMALLRALRPMVQGTSVTGMTITIEGRNVLHTAATSGSAATVNANGICPLRDNWNYHRASLAIPAAQTWDFALGVSNPVISAGGQR